MLCGKPLTLPQPFVDRIVACGQCMACRINKRRQVTARILMEALCYDGIPSTFFTLTYANEHLPQSDCFGMHAPILYKRDLTLYLKKLRQNLGTGLRFFACGEYGDRFQRPHYHGILFGLPPSTNLENIIRDTWDMGHISISEMNDDRAAYVAAYTVKKWTTTDHVKLAGRPPEFSRRSMRPGIGAPFIPRLAAMYETRSGSLVLGQDDDVSGTIRMGPKVWPLDYYMLTKLREWLNLPRLAVERPAKPEFHKDYGQAAKRETLLSIKYQNHGTL